MSAERSSDLGLVVTAPSSDPMDPFKHVVLLMLENHSFDQMLGCMQSLHRELDGIDPAAPPRTSKAPSGATYAQLPVAAFQVKPDPKHEHANVMRQLAGGNAGFIADFHEFYRAKATPEACAQIMAYFPRGSLPALHPLAEQFTICDHWHSSLPGPTWPNRFFALSGTSQGRVLMPSGLHDFGMLWTQTQPTLFDRLNEQNRSWRSYFYDFPASLILRRQRRPDNLAHYYRMGRFFTDAAGPEAEFPDFVFLEPKYFGIDQNDDHPPHNIMKAQKLIGDVYNAIRSNDDLWESTLLVVVYDEHGGFYDHVVPPPAVAPDGNHEEYAFTQLGVRVPALLVSPWLAPSVARTTFDHTSLLKYLQTKWSLGPLGARTAAATGIDAAFEILPTLRQDTPQFIRVPGSQLIPKKPDWEEQDVATHHEWLHLVADTLDVPDAALADTAAMAARAAREVEALRHGFAHFQASAGDALIAAGRALRAPLEALHGARVEKTRKAVAKLIPE